MHPSGERLDVAIVGGGIAGLCVAYELAKRSPDLRWRLFEAGGRLGGKVLSERIEHDAGCFTVEAGPDAFLAQKPWARELAEELGLGDRIIPINRVPRPVAILNQGRPVDLPDGVQLVAPTKLLPFLRSPLLSPLAKARMGLDLVIPPRQGDDDESVGAFVRRRFGVAALDWLAEPLVAGIYNADPDELSLAATFPHYRALERNYGSVLTGLRVSRNKDAAQSPAFLTFRGGMQELTDALVARVSDRANTGAAIDAIRQDADGRFVLNGSHGTASAASIVMATPAVVAAQLTAGCAPNAAHELGRLRTANAGSIALAYPPGAVRRPLRGYGLIVPRRENAPINAITVASSKFAGRAPVGWTLLRVFFGGARSPATVSLEEDELLSLVTAQLRQLLGIEQAPAFHRIHRWPAGSPQYDVGHLDRLARFEQALPAGLFVTGSPYRGVGVPDIVRAARETAAQVAGYASMSRTPAFA